MRRRLSAAALTIATFGAALLTAPAATAAPTPTAPPVQTAATDPSAAATLALVPKAYRGKGRLVIGGSPEDRAAQSGLVKYKNPTRLTVIDGATPALFRVDDYVLNLSQRTNFEGIYRYSATSEPAPCPTTQNCALITAINAGSNGRRVAWSYYLVNVGDQVKAVAGSANMNTYYPTDQRYADVETCAALSHVAGLNYVRLSTDAPSCLNIEPYNSSTPTYWTGADWTYINQLWTSAGIPTP